MAVTVTLSGLVGTLTNDAVGGRGTLPRVLRAMGVMAVSDVRKNMTGGMSYQGVPFAPLKHTRPEGGSKPLLDKGLLRASISATVSENELILQASHPGAALQQFGGTVRAKKGKYLSIPLTKEAKRVGSPRRFSRHLFFLAVHNARGGGVLVERAARGGALVAQYRLVESVTIPARPYLGFSSETLTRIAQLLGETYEGAVITRLGGATVV